MSVIHFYGVVLNCFSTGTALLFTTAWSRMGKCRYSSTICNLGSWLSWVVSFTPRPLCPSPRYPLCRRQGALAIIFTPTVTTGHCSRAVNPWQTMTVLSIFRKHSEKEARRYDQNRDILSEILWTWWTYVDQKLIVTPDRLWGPPYLLSNGYRRLFPRG
jgi:hypothetical protein